MANAMVNNTTGYGLGTLGNALCGPLPPPAAGLAPDAGPDPSPSVDDEAACAGVRVVVDDVVVDAERRIGFKAHRSIVRLPQFKRNGAVHAFNTPPPTAADMVRATVLQMTKAGRRQTRQNEIENHHLLISARGPQRNQSVRSKLMVSTKRR